MGREVGSGKSGIGQLRVTPPNSVLTKRKNEDRKAFVHAAMWITKGTRSQENKKEGFIPRAGVDIYVLRSSVFLTHALRISSTPRSDQKRLNAESKRVKQQIQNGSVV